MLFRVVEEARVARREMAIALRTEEGKRLGLEIRYAELWQRPDMVTTRGSGSTVRSPMDSQRERSQSLTHTLERLGVDSPTTPPPHQDHLTTTRSGESDHQYFPVPIGTGSISSTHKLQKLREQHENHMMILERLADADGVQFVKVGVETSEHVFCEAKEDIDVVRKGSGGRVKDGVVSDRHKRLLLEVCDGCKAEGKTVAEEYSEWF